MTGPLANSLLTRLAEYVMANQQRVQDPTFNVGTFDFVRSVLGFHAMQGSLRVEWQTRIVSGLHERIQVTEPAGLAIVWRDKEEVILDRIIKDQNVWHGQAEARDGDCLFLALVITTHPAALPRLARYFAERHPVLPEYAWRRGKVRRTEGLIHRLAAPAQPVSVPSPQPEPAYV